MKKAIVLLSGGLDSATVLYYAKKNGFTTHCLIFDYGQRHRKEIVHAQRIARAACCDYQVVKIPLPWKNSALLNKSFSLPKRKSASKILYSKQIPSTYVPARNIIFLSFAASYAESINAGAIFIGANSVDYSGYPDCRPQFMKAFTQTIRVGTKGGVNNRAPKIATPLINKTKAQIIKLGMTLGVPYQLTWSCYKGLQRPCGECDSCLLRAKGFQEAGAKDPLQ
ncbi:7-cyano-7-deazaguanine synthase QueC [Candidatus Omnitrophota bacterium]